MISNIKLQKKILRKAYLARRRKLSLFESLEKSTKIAQRVLDLSEIKDKDNFSIYLPINREVYTDKIIDGLSSREANIFLPSYSRENRTYFFCQFIDWEDLEEGPFKILQPRNGSVVDPKLIEVAFIPAIAFSSKTGVRLGYGKAVFDKLLANSKALKIGLVYDFQVVDDVIPQEKHDLTVDMIVTDKRVLRSQFTVHSS